VAAGRSPRLVRFFGWSPPAVSLGYNQPASDLDLESCARAGFEVVRRPTGGRAVVHRDEFTYSVIAPESDPLASGGVMESYRRIAAGLLAGLELLGVAAEMSRSALPENPARGAALCFAAAGRYEITAGGRKLIGSAQRRMNGVMIQQGSLLLSCDQNLPLLPGGRSFPAETATLKGLLGREVDFAEAARAMERGFARAWGIDFAGLPPSGDEEQRCRELAPGFSIGKL
jgi:lipoate-protein ligase A